MMILPKNIYLLSGLPRKVSAEVLHKPPISSVPVTLYSSFIIYRILIASIHNLGNCPCPRCLIPLSHVHNLGTTRDMAQRIMLARADNIQRSIRVSATRGLIYEKNLQVNSAAVENLLQEMSLVPTAVCNLNENLFQLAMTLIEKIFQNVFSDRLSPMGFNLFRMLLPDLMHEVELRIWKSLFIHLLQILQSIDESLLVELDHR